MRGDEWVRISRAELEALKKEAEKKIAAGQLFSSEEMQAIRDQYQELLDQERQRRDEIEWKLRMELARIRNVEIHARRSADDLRQLEESLLAVLEDGGDGKVRPADPASGLQATPSRPQAPSSSPMPQPPPIPQSPAPRPGSHAETFRQAMAGRKRYQA
jgi:hypothetical protein